MIVGPVNLIVGPVKDKQLLGEHDIHISEIRDYFKEYKEVDGETYSVRCQGMVDDAYLNEYEKPKKKGAEMFYTRENANDTRSRIDSILIFFEQKRLMELLPKQSSRSSRSSPRRTKLEKQSHTMIYLKQYFPETIPNKGKKLTKRSFTQHVDKDIVCELALICNDSDPPKRGLGKELFRSLLDEIKKRHPEGGKIVAGQALPVDKELAKKPNKFYEDWTSTKKKDEEGKELYLLYEGSSKPVLERVMTYEFERTKEEDGI